MPQGSWNWLEARSLGPCPPLKQNIIWIFTWTDKPKSTFNSLLTLTGSVYNRCGFKVILRRLAIQPLLFFLYHFKSILRIGREGGKKTVLEENLLQVICDCAQCIHIGPQQFTSFEKACTDWWGKSPDCVPPDLITWWPRSKNQEGKKKWRKPDD